MNPTKFFLGPAVFLAILSTGCGSVSRLYIPESNGPIRSFPPAPPAVIRLPVVITIPQTESLLHNLSELFHGDFKNGIPDLAHWTGQIGFSASKTLLKWNLSGGRLLLGVNLHWLESIGKNTGVIPSPTPGTVSNGDLPLWWNNWNLEIQNPTPDAGNPKKSLSRTAIEMIERAEAHYTHVQISQLNQVLKGISDLKPKAGDIWDLMQNPIFLDKGIWLLVQPDSISTGIMGTDPKNPLKLNTVLEMTAHPILFFGDAPEVKKKALPPLQHFVPGRAGFTAVSNTLISFKEANRFLNDPRTNLVNTIIPGSGNRKLTVRGIRLYNSGEKVIAEVRLNYNPFLINFTGKPANMTIYFRGTPHYSLKRQTFYMPDLDFDVKTTDFLVQVADWIFKSDIRDELRRKAQIPVGPKLASLKNRMNEVLNCPLGTLGRLETKVKSFRLLHAFADREGIKAQVSLDGDAQLNVVW